MPASTTSSTTACQSNRLYRIRDASPSAQWWIRTADTWDRCRRWILENWTWSDCVLSLESSSWQWHTWPAMSDQMRTPVSIAIKSMHRNDRRPLLECTSCKMLSRIATIRIRFLCRNIALPRRQPPAKQSRKKEQTFDILCQELCGGVRFLPATLHSNSKMSPEWSTGLSSTIRIRLRSRSLVLNLLGLSRGSYLMFRYLYWQAAPSWLTQYLCRFASWTTPEIRTMTESTIPVEPASDLHISIEDKNILLFPLWLVGVTLTKQISLSTFSDHSIFTVNSIDNCSSSVQMPNTFHLVGSVRHVCAVDWDWLKHRVALMQVKFACESNREQIIWMSYEKKKKFFELGNGFK